MVDWTADPTSAIVRVGASGRGFVMESGRLGRLVITATLCLPKLPAWDNSAMIYRNLIGDLDEKPSVSALCFFADPISDLAVLVALKDDRDKTDTYEAFVARRPPLGLAPLPAKPEIEIDSSRISVAECVDHVIRYLESQGRLKN